MERSLIPRLEDDHFFDDFFKDMNRSAMRQHHDLRNAMIRLSPRDPIGDIDRELEDHIKQLRHPLTTRPDGTEALDLKIDLSHYKPEEIHIRTVGHELSVHAKHEDKTDHSSVYQEYSRKFTLPGHVNPEHVQSTLSRDGVLKITAPLDKSIEPPSKKIAIEHKKK